MTIGRKPYNDIQIDNLAVSGEHAMIMTILNDSFLEDLDSTNGTMVNGNPVNKHFLQNDDVVEIGRYKLKYVKEKADAMSQQEFEKTMVLRSSAADTPNVKTATDANNSAAKQGGQTNTPATVAQAGMKTDTGIAQTAPGGQSQQSEKKSPVASVAQVGTKTDTGIAQTAPGGQSQQSEKKSPV
ncbi:MAG: FHA domain-containing protein, partial [Betaproteobacteria bacterium]